MIPAFQRHCLRSVLQAFPHLSNGYAQFLSEQDIPFDAGLNETWGVEVPVDSDLDDSHIGLGGCAIIISLYADTVLRLGVRSHRRPQQDITSLHMDLEECSGGIVTDNTVPDNTEMVL